MCVFAYLTVPVKLNILKMLKNKIIIQRIIIINKKKEKSHIKFQTKQIKINILLRIKPKLVTYE